MKIIWSLALFIFLYKREHRFHLYIIIVTEEIKMNTCVLCSLTLLCVAAVTIANNAGVSYYLPTYGYTGSESGGFNSFGDGGIFQMIIFLFVFIFIIQLLFGTGGLGGGSGGYHKGGSSYSDSLHDHSNIY